MKKTNITPKNVYLFLRHHFTAKPYDYPYQDKDMNIVPLGLDLDRYYADLLSFSKGGAHKVHD